jgi:uncharacterized protein
MSQENVEIVRDAFDAFTRGDIAGVLGRCDENIVITQPAELPGAPAQQRGHRGMLEAFALWPEQWDDFRIEILRIVADPSDHVVVVTRQRGRGRQSGIEVDIEMTFVFTVLDKKIVEWQLFMHEDQALEAAGLSE